MQSVIMSLSRADERAGKCWEEPSTPCIFAGATNYRDPPPRKKKKDSLMTSNVTLQTAWQLSGLMVSWALHKWCSSRPLKQKATKSHASASSQRLATCTANLKRRKKTSFFIYCTSHKRSHLE